MSNLQFSKMYKLATIVILNLISLTYANINIYLSTTEVKKILGKIQFYFPLFT